MDVILIIFAALKFKPEIMTDLDIAKSVQPKHIKEIAQKVNVKEDDLEFYGKYKAKLPLDLTNEDNIKNSNLILVTAISPTPAGEGKTTTSIGLHDGLNKIGKNSIVVLREPSLGPVFGIKGGAAGGGYSQVIPMEDINLHFTGDFSAVEKANNLLSALIDNNLQSKTKSVGLDARTVMWKRVMDMNDRALRNITIGLGGLTGGIPRQDGFNITAASEVMAILCMSKNLEDLKNRFANIYVGDKMDKTAVFAKDVEAEGAMAALMKDAIKPNLVQTLEHNPAIIHGGPFANIAQGTNTITATKMGMSIADYTVTEAGFGADLGAEKFLNIKCRAAGISPKAVVIVATIRALKYHGGADLKELTTENLEALDKGIPNLEKHIENMQSFGLPVVVSINAFSSDTDAELNLVKERCDKLGVKAAISTGWADGGAGCTELAEYVVEAAESCKGDFKPTYELEDTIEDKINKIAKTIYGADGVNFTPKARKQMKRFAELGFDKFPVCMAKTQKSLTDVDSKRGRPSGFSINIREFEVAAGAGFIVPIAGNILRMPGLPASPASERIDVDAAGNIEGLF